MFKKLFNSSFKEKLYSRNRFVILDEDTFEEKFPFFSMLFLDHGTVLSFGSLKKLSKKEM
jgi:hypothetical protein